MKCPSCGAEMKTLGTRNVYGGTVVRRRRQCKECLFRLTTYEIEQGMFDACCSEFVIRSTESHGDSHSS